MDCFKNHGFCSLRPASAGPSEMARIRICRPAKEGFFISRGLGKDTRSKTQDTRHVSNGVNGLHGFIATKTPRHEEN